MKIVYSLVKQLLVSLLSLSLITGPALRGNRVTTGRAWFYQSITRGTNIISVSVVEDV